LFVLDQNEKKIKKKSIKQRKKNFLFFSFYRLASNQTIKSILVHSQSSPRDNQTIFYPPPPPAFSSRTDSTSSKPQNVY
jgi:hypothetical protein